MDNINGLLDKEMSRKQFLLYVGLLLMSLLGISGFFKKIREFNSPQKGFGSGPYGGK